MPLVTQATLVLKFNDNTEQYIDLSSVYGARAITLPPAATRVIFNEATQQIFVDGREVQAKFSEHQRRAIFALWEKRGRVVHRDDLIRAVWLEARHPAVYTASLYSLVKRLRVKLGREEDKDALIATVDGVGFRLVEHSG